MSRWKRRRLKNFDYSTVAAYFITICTKNRECLLWEKGDLTQGKEYKLSAYGEIVKVEIETISEKYPSLKVDNYVIMPNHIHMLIVNKEKDKDISVVINQTKGKITRKIGFSLWQNSFHDHIIRNDREYEKIWNYIVYNPTKWNEDKYYI